MKHKRDPAPLPDLIVSDTTFTREKMQRRRKAQGLYQYLQRLGSESLIDYQSSTDRLGKYVAKKQYCRRKLQESMIAWTVIR